MCIYRMSHLFVSITTFLWLFFGRFNSEEVPNVAVVKSQSKHKLRNQIFCGNDTTRMDCSTHPACKTLLRKFESEGKVSSWNRRHQSLGEHYRRFNCSTAIEIGIARAELSTYLLSSIPAIVEYHAVRTRVYCIYICCALSELRTLGGSVYGRLRPERHHEQRDEGAGQLSGNYFLGCCADFSANYLKLQRKYAVHVLE